MNTRQLLPHLELLHDCSVFLPSLSITNTVAIAITVMNTLLPSIGPPGR